VKLFREIVSLLCLVSAVCYTVFFDIVVRGCNQQQWWIQGGGSSGDREHRWGYLDIFRRNTKCELSLGN